MYFYVDVYWCAVFDELKTCVAAFFQNRGKEVITVKEFTMIISLDLRWLPVKEADRLVTILLNEGLLEKTSDGLLRIDNDLKDLDVPMAYKPSRELLEYIRNAKISSTKADKVEKEHAQANIGMLMEVAESKGMQKGKFIAECNKIVKKMNIDIEVAALMVLRDHGVDVSPYYDDVYAYVANK